MKHIIDKVYYLETIRDINLSDVSWYCDGSIKKLNPMLIKQGSIINCSPNITWYHNISNNYIMNGFNIINITFEGESLNKDDILYLYLKSKIYGFDTDNNTVIDEFYLKDITSSVELELSRSNKFMDLGL